MEEETVNIDLVVKLGGSAITDKGKLETLRPEALADAARLIKECTDRQLTCVIVHGAGSFGHHHAKQYNVQSGWADCKDQKETVLKGFCLTRQSVTKLHHTVTSALLEENIPAVGLSVCGTWENSCGILCDPDLTPVTCLLRAGMMPVLHGDCVLDKVKGCSILSGDTIIQALCRWCKVKRVVFLTSVTGLYNKPPDLYTDAQLLHQVTVSEDGQMVTSSAGGGAIDSQSSGEHDVTGGMTLKLSTATQIVTQTDRQTQVFICQIGSTYAQHVCLHGHQDGCQGEGTCILRA